ncbi:putative retrotransposon protein [Panicum miliaceum]|uniref:Retrotransposon protein n=1 Tax=Panicum miliaceum TaxID=4540 RepID=A0A3L6PGI1_PANMI|nr:putative retrotransposon protein [Panicum miliaceum]
MVHRVLVAAGATRAPKEGETSAHPEKDEVVVFHNVFTAGLRFPLDPMFMETLQSFDMFLYQLTPNSIARLNLYFLLAKTFCFKPSADDFTFVHWVHYQPKIIGVMRANDIECEAEAHSFCAKINANSMESWADDILGAESIGEYKAIFQKLGGTRTNRVFQALGIEAPRRVAALNHQAAEEKKLKKEKAQGATVADGTSTNAHLEKKKRKLGPKTSGPPKWTRIADILFGAYSLLKAKGDSEDTGDEEAGPLATPPLASALSSPSRPRVFGSGSSQLLALDVSDQEAEKDEDDGEHIDIVGSPVGGAKIHDLVVAEAIPSPRKAPSSS